MPVILDPVNPLARVLGPVLLAALLAAPVALAQHAGADAPPPPETRAAPPAAAAPPSDTGAAPSVPRGAAGVVVRVIDGDTIEVEGLGRVRLLGVDSPESVDPRREVQPFGEGKGDGDQDGKRRP